MGHLRPSFFLLLLLGFLCVASGNPISSLFGKSDDAKTAEDEKDVKDAGVTTTTTTAATPAAGTTASSCSGLSGFFHLCDKNEQTEPPKKVKRDASEEDDSDSDSDSDSDEDEEKKEEATPSASEVEKRQVGDPEAPVLGEVPTVLEDAVRAPEEEDGQEEEGSVKRRQVEDSDDKDEENEDPEDEEDMEETSRRRRDCSDYGESSKNCRRKREYVPSCFGLSCVKKTTDAAETTESN